MMVLKRRLVVVGVSEFLSVVFSSPHFALEDLLIVCWLLVSVLYLRPLSAMLLLELAMKNDMIEVGESQMMWQVLQKWLMLTELMLEVAFELWMRLCAL